MGLQQRGEFGAFLRFQCFLVKRKWLEYKSVPAHNRLLIQIHHFSKALSALLFFVLQKAENWEPTDAYILLFCVNLSK